MEYQGMFKTVNEKPSSEWINVFVSDWNKEHWAFYVYINKDTYETDIEEINALITKLNFRDGDVYVELIDHSPELEGFYHYFIKTRTIDHNEILDLEYWEMLEEKGDFHFKAFSELNGGTRKEDIQQAEFSSFSDWYEVLETFHPDLAKALDDSNGWGAFDIPQFFNCQGFHEIEDCIVLECD